MNRKLIASSLVSFSLIAAAGSALAQTSLTSDAYPEGSPFAWVPQTSQLTREQVRAELVQARAQGLLNTQETTYPTLQSSGPSASRAQVEQALIQTSLNGELHAPQNP